MTEIAMTSPSDTQPTKDELTQEERLFIADRLLARARHQSKKILNVERGQKTLHPELMKHMRDDIAECTRLALRLQQ
jgi:hypothetical protein